MHGQTTTDRQQVDGEDEEFAHEANANMIASTRNTVPTGEFPNAMNSPPTEVLNLAVRSTDSTRPASDVSTKWSGHVKL